MLSTGVSVGSMPYTAFKVMVPIVMVPKPVIKATNVKTLWYKNIQLQTDHLIEYRRPDITAVDKDRVIYGQNVIRNWV